MAKKLDKKFIGDDQVGSSQILIEKSASIRGTLQSDVVVDLLNLNSSDEVLLKGVKVLNAAGQIPADVLPSYVDDVLEFANLAAFPATGEVGKIYVALDTNKCFRWSGSTYIQITSGAVDSVNGATGVVVLDAGDISMVSAPGTSVESKLVSLQGDVDSKVAKSGDTMSGTLNFASATPAIYADFSGAGVTATTTLASDNISLFYDDPGNIEQYNTTFSASYANFNSSISGVYSEIILDGATGAISSLVNSAAFVPTSPEHLAPKAYVDTFIPLTQKDAAFGVPSLDVDALISKWQIKNLEAFKVEFTPYNMAHWYTGFEPADVSAALNQLALKIAELDAFQISYAPYTPAHWYTGFEPSQVSAALDQLAQKIALLNAGQVSYTAIDSADWITGFVPTNSGWALDQLAMRLKDVEAGEGSNLGSFSGSTIPDGQTIKGAIQALETAHEAHLNDTVGAHAASAISLSPAINGQIEVQAALGDHESRIDVLEGALVPTWTRQKFDLTATDVSNGYVTLAHEAVGESIHASVDRLQIHQGEDFTISVVGGFTKITFAGALITPGQSQLDATDNIYVKYQYLA